MLGNHDKEEEEEKQPQRGIDEKLVIGDNYLNTVDLLSETGKSVSEFNEIDERSAHRKNKIQQQIASHRTKIPAVSKQLISARSS